MYIKNLINHVKSENCWEMLQRFNLLIWMVTVYTVWRGIKSVCILLTECMYMLRMIIAVDTNYFPIEH
jgi:hypothetical protein